MTRLIVDHLSKRWPDGQTALDDISFEAEAGALTVLIGPSGAGKSTLLRIVAGLTRADNGEICGVTEQPVMVFQEDSLWPHLTLLENVSLPLRVLGRIGRTGAEERAKVLLYEWGLADRLDAYPAELSGGQRQRGALARALVSEPKILCLDEVTSGLDPEASAGILDTILRLKTTETIMLMATHQLNFARASADTAIFMERGRLIEKGPNLLSAPQDPRVLRFLCAFDCGSRTIHEPQRSV